MSHKEGTPFISACNNLAKIARCWPILTILSQPHSQVNCGKKRNKIYHFISNLLPHYLAKTKVQLCNSIARYSKQIIDRKKTLLISFALSWTPAVHSAAVPTTAYFLEFPPLVLSSSFLRNRRWGGCVYVLQMFFVFLRSPQKYQTTLLGNGWTDFHETFTKR